MIKCSALYMQPAIKGTDDMTKRTDEHIRREAEGVCYTVWIEVEKQDPDNDVYQTEPVDFGSTATFTTYEEAEAVSGA